jgi:crotonobetainyl-CoA:carnitine CoA-transferase CaiB-like acyl-CoA transferase
MSPLPLEKIRVLDLTRVLAGPLASQMLADFGAEIIKIERPGKGDDSRTYGPPYLTDPEGRPLDNAFYLSANRGKKSVTVDIASPGGQSIIRELAKTSDVFMENFKVGDLARYGLDYPSIRKLNPGIVYCSVTGFGQSGPYSSRPGYDAVFQAMGGLMSVTGHPDDEPGGGPMKVGPSIVDVMTGMNAAIGVLTALYHRDANGGVGQHVDVALLDSVIASLSHYAQIYLVSGQAPPRRGTGGNGGVPSQTFRCSDGSVMLTAGNDAQFAKLCNVLGNPELATDPRFADNNGRVANRNELIALLSARFLQKPASDWLSMLQQAGVPSGPINTLEQVFADPHVRNRGMEVRVAHPLRDSLSLIANPIRFSETPVSQYLAPPMLGQDTTSVLRERLGFDGPAIAALREAGVI